MSDINLPRRVHKGLATGADWGNSVRESIARLANRVNRRNANPNSDTEPPFWPTLRVVSSSSYKVAISKGFVFEHVTKTGDGVITHTLADLVDANEFPAEFEVAAGKAIYVRFGVKDTGEIKTTEADKPQIVIDDDGQASEHYDPPCGAETAGTDGFIYHKLAVLDDSGDAPELVRYAAGSHITHYRELPMFVKAGGTADVFKEFDLSAGKYKTRGLKGSGGITVTQNTDDIDIKCAGWWGDVVIDYTPAVGSTDSLTMRFEDGILKRVFKTAGEVSGTEATPGNANLTIVDTDT